MKSNRVILLLGLTVAVILLAGVTHLFLLRFQAGDVYPPYSSLRADPLGTRILYDSLARCEGVSVERNFRPVSRMDLPRDAALLFLGDTLGPYDALPGDTIGRLNSFVRKGGRIVITLLPRNRDPDEGASDETEPGETPADETADESAPGEETPAHTPAHEERPTVINALDWLAVDLTDLPVEGDTTALLALDPPAPGLPPLLSCHTSICFTNRVSADGTTSNTVPAPWPWRTVYARDGYPVVVERRLGRGSIVLSALSFFVSNEAMRDERYPELLVWLVEAKPRVVFDETHHGLTENHGIGTLARRYRLHGALLGSVLLGLLFIWQRAAELVPGSRRTTRDEDAAPAKGRGSAAGLTNLLRRNVPTSSLLQTCLDEWRRGLPHAGQEQASAIEAMQQIVDHEKAAPLHRRDPKKAYNKMAAIVQLHRSNSKWTYRH